MLITFLSRKHYVQSLNLNLIIFFIETKLSKLISTLQKKLNLLNIFLINYF